MSTFQKGVLILTLLFVFFFPPIELMVNAQTKSEILQSEISTSSSEIQEEVKNSSPINLTVSPISLNLETDPGVPISSEIKVLNNGSQTEYLELSLAKFRADETGSRPRIEDFTSEDYYAEWIKFSQPKFTAEPGQWVSVPFDFNPPADAALGYLYAILVKRQEEVINSNDTAVISGIPAVLVIAMVNSPLAVKELSLESFISTQRIYEFLPATFEVTIKNSGNVATQPKGTIFIDSQDQKDVAILNLNPGGGLVLPQSSRKYELSWLEGFPNYEVYTDENGKPQRRLSWDWSTANHFRFGEYTANLLFVYDNGERDVPVEATLSFWVIPWRIIAGAILVIGLLVWAIISPFFLLRKKRLKN